MTIILATHNEGKIKDYQKFLSEGELKSLKDLGITHETIEDQDTFEGNAIKKALELHNLIGGIVLADDSGIEVDYLDGKPGIYSARYAGDHDDTANNLKLLSELKGVPKEKRGASLVTVIAVVSEINGELISKTFRGELRGKITTEPRGNNGFAYDCLFEVDNTSKTLSEMTDKERELYSHRKKALLLAKEEIMVYN